MANNPNRPLPGYPNYVGKKYHNCFDHTGPASYVNPGGDIINALDIGLGGIDEANCIGQQVFSVSGNYYVIAAALGSGLSQKNMTLVWYVASTNVQVANAVNLSAETIRIVLTGV